MEVEARRRWVDGEESMKRECGGRKYEKRRLHTRETWKERQKDEMGRDKTETRVRNKEEGKREGERKVERWKDEEKGGIFKA